MILLDHNIPESQADQLRRWRIRFRQIGFEVGRPEWDDQEEILRYLHAAKRVTFFTRDLGFFRRRLCHPNYCLVVGKRREDYAAASGFASLRHALPRIMRNAIDGVDLLTGRG